MNRLLFVVVFVIVCVGALTVLMKREKTIRGMNTLMLENVEALAGNENFLDNDCFGVGSLICPSTGRKVYICKWISFKINMYEKYDAHYTFINV